MATLNDLYYSSPVCTVVGVRSEGILCASSSEMKSTSAEEFEELTSGYTPNDRDGIYSGDNLTFTVDGEPRTVNSVTISSRQVGNDTLYSETLKKHYLNPIYVTNVIIKGFPGKKDRITIPAISSLAELRGCIDIHPEYYDCFGKFTGSILDRHEFQGLELQLISR